MPIHRRVLVAVCVILLTAVLGSLARSAARDGFGRSRSWSIRQDQPREAESLWRSGANSRRQHKLKKIPANRDRKPNIILVVTDDQDVELGSMNFMPKTLRLLQDGGVHFPNSYVTTPMCCPSRSSMLTGMYVHNHNVFTNNDNCSSPYWQQTHETRSFATYLSNVGYRTGYFGKYLNEYNGSYVPPGWREWAGLIRNSRFYNYTINLNGNKIKHGDDYFKDYYPDLITNDSITFLQQSKKGFVSKPVMMVLSYPSPHGPEDAAPQFHDLFKNITTHRTRSWNYAPNPDKQWILRHTKKMEPIHIKFTDMLHTRRLQTLQTVDEALERLYTELKNLGELENTYIFYTSDHGYHLGQFGLVKGKAMPFEFDVKVPFYVRGPKVPVGIKIPNVVLNLDLAPTFLDIAGVEIPEHMDGKSVLKLLVEANELATSGRRSINMEIRRKKTWRDTFLIESAGRRSADRKHHWREQANKHSALPEPSIPYQETTMTKDQRLAILCQKPDYQSPCQPSQQQMCVHDGSRWRIHKCRFNDDHKRRHKNNCNCYSDSGTNPVLKMNPDEENAQRAFLKEHLNKKEFKPHFIGARNQRSIEQLNSEEDQYIDDDFNGDEFEMEDAEDFESDELRMPKQQLIHTKKDNVGIEAGDFSDANEDDKIYHSSAITSYYEDLPESVGNTTTIPQPTEMSTMLSELHHRITERSLKKLHHTKLAGCHLVNGSYINCTDAVYRDPGAWRENKDIVDDQIKQLKHKLEELKGIRKHLKEKRPGDQTHHATRFGASTLSPILPVFLDNGEEVEEALVIGEPDEEEIKHKMTTCDCNPIFGNRRFGPRKISRTDDAREERRRWKEERLRNKERKNKKKAKYLNTTCNAEKMNCFTHDNMHWKTAPFWTYGPFCFCQNANNNTYWCTRTLNDTHNFLFCEFVTGFLSYYDMRTDPYQMRNIIHDVPEEIVRQLQHQLMKLRECRGAKECTVRSRPHHEGRGGGHLEDDTYRSDIASAQIAKHSSRHWKQNRQRWSQKRRRQNTS